MTTNEFCNSRGVASGSFYAWLKEEKLHGKYSKSSRFVEIHPEGATLAVDEGADRTEAITPFASLRLGGLQLDIHQQVDAEYLRALLIG